MALVRFRESLTGDITPGRCSSLVEWKSRAAFQGYGLDNVEYVGGVLWFGLTRREAEKYPAERRRVIVNRLVRWATRNGGDGSQVARAGQRR